MLEVDLALRMMASRRRFFLKMTSEGDGGMLATSAHLPSISARFAASVALDPETLSALDKIASWRTFLRKSLSVGECGRSLEKLVDTSSSDALVAATSRGTDLGNRGFLSAVSAWTLDLAFSFALAAFSLLSLFLLRRRFFDTFPSGALPLDPRPRLALTLALAQPSGSAFSAPMPTSSSTKISILEGCVCADVLSRGVVRQAADFLSRARRCAIGRRVVRWRSETSVRSLLEATAKPFLLECRRLTATDDSPAKMKSLQ